MLRERLTESQVRVAAAEVERRSAVEGLSNAQEQLSALRREKTSLVALQAVASSYCKQLQDKAKVASSLGGVVRPKTPSTGEGGAAAALAASMSADAWLSELVPSIADYE